MGVGILLGGLAGAAQGFGSAIAQQQKFEDEKELLTERIKLEEEKQLRIDEITKQRTRQAGILQGQDISAEIARLMNERDATSINASQGSSMTAEDAQILRGKPTARKAFGLEEETRKSILETRALAAENLGYLDAAKEARGQIQTEITNLRNEATDKSTNRRLDLLQNFEERRASRQDASQAREETRLSESEARERRASTSKSLDSVMADIRSYEKEAADRLIAPERKAVVERQLSVLRNKAEHYQSLLDSVGIKDKSEQTVSDLKSTPYPDGTRLKKDGQVYIVKDGVPVLESKVNQFGAGKIITK